MKEWIKNFSLRDLFSKPLITFYSYWLILAFLLSPLSILWGRTGDEIVSFSFWFFFSARMYFRFKEKIETKDELKRQVNLEIYAKTYSFILPFFFLIAIVAYHFWNLWHEAIVILGVLLIIVITKQAVSFFVKRKYDYEEEDEYRYIK